MPKENRVYPIRTFSELDPAVRRSAVIAGQLGFVRMYGRFKGAFSSTVNEAAKQAWDEAMDRSDLTYGTCTCGDSNSRVCPSYDEHALVSSFIDEMEDLGRYAAEQQLPLSRKTLETFTADVTRHLSR